MKQYTITLTTANATIKGKTYLDKAELDNAMREMRDVFAKNGFVAVVSYEEKDICDKKPRTMKIEFELEHTNNIKAEVELMLYGIAGSIIRAVLSDETSGEIKNYKENVIGKWEV